MKYEFFLMNITFIPINRRYSASQTQIQFSIPIVFPLGVLGVNASEPVGEVVGGGEVLL